MDIRQNGTNSFLKAAGESKCKDVTVLTWDYEAKEAADKLEIHYQPLWKWLIKGSVPLMHAR